MVSCGDGLQGLDLGRAVSGKLLLKRLKKLGFEEVKYRGKTRGKGSHIALQKGNRHTYVPVHGNEDLPKGTAAAILREAGVTWDEILGKN